MLLVTAFRSRSEPIKADLLDFIFLNFLFNLNRIYVAFGRSLRANGFEFKLKNSDF